MLTYKNIKDIYSLSSLQKGMYFHALYDPGSMAYFEQLVYRFEGEIKVETIRKSLKVLFDRHDVLRTVFNHEKIDEPLQIVLKEVDLDFCFEDLRSIDEKADRIARLHQYKQKDKQTPFDLTKDVLMRVALFQLEDEEFEFIWTHHHIIIDGWCTEILIAEFFEIYNALLHQRPYKLAKVTPYRVYIDWLEKQDQKASFQYWKEYLDGYEGKEQLPKDQNSANLPYDRRIHQFSVDSDCFQQLQLLSKGEGVTLNVVMQVLWAVFVAKYSGQNDVLFGTVVSGRPPEIKDIASMLGLFVNTIPVRIRFDDSDNFKDLLKVTHQNAIAGQDYVYQSLAEIQEKSGLKQGDIDHLYGFQNYLRSADNAKMESSPDKDEDEVRVMGTEAFEQTNYDFVVKLAPGEALQVIFEYNANAYSEDTIKSFEREWKSIIRQVADRQGCLKIYDISTAQLSSQQLNFITELNKTGTNFPKDQSVVDLFHAVVAENPDKTAIVDGTNKFTYAQLDEKSNQIAHFLLKLQVPSEAIVAIYQQQSFNLIASILGVLKAGAAYLPVNTTYPVNRIKGMLVDLQVPVLLSESVFIKEINQLQWQCPRLHSFVCIDSDDIFSLKEQENRLMSKELWGYVEDNADDDIAAGGWLSSYTGEKLSREEMDEYAENVVDKLKPYCNAQTKVLEIGCASGITMFRMAEFVDAYHGTDLSQGVIDRNQKIVEEKSIDNIHLSCIQADEIDKLGIADFDVIIINSVVQCFSGYNYLRQIIKKAIDHMAPEGLIFLGDIMDLDKKDLMVASLTSYKEKHPDANTKLDFEDELFISRQFMDDLKGHFPEIVDIKHSNKIHQIKNELTDFRYDTIIEIDKAKKNNDVTKQKFQYSKKDLDQFSKQAVDLKVKSDQLSNVIYTSGSTGKPKGILIEHRGLVRLVRNTNYMKVTAKDVWAQTVDISFDPSTLEIFGALLNGASLCLINKETLLDTEDLRAVINEQHISMMVLITPLFHEIASIQPGIFSNLHTLIIGGEALNPKHVNKVLANCPGLNIINAYGPTENTVISTTFSMQESVEKMLIGKPMSNSEAYIVGDNNDLLPLGVMGELCVAGSGLARGYVNNPVLTHEKFVPHPIYSGRLMYKTGDKARYTSSGDIAIYGRKDEQVKVRGFRIELGEIERAILDIKGVEDAAVILTGMEQSQSLTAFVKTIEKLDQAQLIQKLAQRLPEYMLPDRILFLDKLPLTSNGKVDRKALAGARYEVLWNENANIVAPRNEDEKQLMEIWISVLGNNLIGVKNNFFDVGGHSLKAMQVVSRISKVFKVKVNLKDFFANPTIEALAHLIRTKEEQLFQEIVPVPKSDYYKVSHAQKRLWILNQFEENQIAYNISGAFRFENLDKQIFEKVLEDIIARHESLRTTFVTVDGEPMQKISDNALDLGIKLEHINLSEQNANEETVQQIAQKEMVTPFDLENGPLVRMKLLNLPDQISAFLFTMHHIISDGWSMRVLMQEVNHLYESYLSGTKEPLPPLRIQYKDFVAWQYKTIEEKDEKYWLKKLSGELNWVNLPKDYEGVDYHSFIGSEEHMIIGSEEKKALYEIARANKTSLSNVFFTIFNILLYNISNQEDLVVGMAIANRNHQEIEKIVGFFVNTLVIRTKISEDAEFEDILKQVTDNITEAFDHQNYPFDLLVQRLNPERVTNKQPIFNVLYGFQNFTDVSVDIDNEHTTSQNESKDQALSADVYAQKVNSSKFDLTLFVYENKDGILISFEYNSTLFRSATIKKWLRYFEKFFDLIIGETA
jgi:amino acid adenylation domain-containing protein